MERTNSNLVIEDKNPKNLLEFKEDFYNGVKIKADAANDFFEAAFVDEYTKQLLEVGEITSDFIPAFWSIKGMRVDGYAFDDTNEVLYLFIASYSGSPDDSNLTQTEIDQQFKRLEKFYKKSFDESPSMDDSLPVYELAHLINKRQDNLTRIKYYLLSDKVLSGRVTEIPSKEVRGVVHTYHVWDISRLFRMNSSRSKKEDIIIDFNEICDSPVYALPANISTDEFRSYLFILPGSVLFEVYDRYGARLLEQNVRTFLQVRGNVNKGIRNTILHKPDRFFAYNNGLTATAEKISFDDEHGVYRINTLHNLQIVNGGQTTASIFHAVRKDGAELSKIFVQVKLTIVSSKEAEEMVPKISEYANTQNKVSAADFFSNHQFHIKMQEFSRSVWAPAADGRQRESKWFYERARGQYLDELSNRSASEKKQFMLEYPKSQVFTKTDLAKYLSVWDENPHIVSKGAQYAFMDFAKSMQKLWEEKESHINSLFYQTAVAKVIIFQKTESIVSDSDWYNGGFRAQIVAYTLSLLAHKVSIARLCIDFNKIWNTQTITPAMSEQIRCLAEEVCRIITHPPNGSANPSQWAKKIECWDEVKKIQRHLTAVFRKELIDADQIQDEKRSAERSQAGNDLVALELKIYKINASVWKEVLKFGSQNNITDRETSLLKTAMDKTKLPSERQALAIRQIVERFKMIGMEVDGCSL